MKTFTLFALFLALGSSHAADRPAACYFEKSINQCYVLPVEALHAEIVVPTTLQKSICISRLCIQNNPRSSKAAPMITIEGEIASGQLKSELKAELEPSRDHDGDILYGYYDYSVKLHDSVEAKGTKKVSCSTTASPNCFMYEHDVYRAATVTMRMRLYDKRDLDYFSISALFYDASKTLKDGPIVQSVEYYKTRR